MDPDHFTLAVNGARAVLDLRVGHLAALAFTVGGRHIAPLHRAPWSDEPDAGGDRDILPVERHLSGDFLCAPFAANDVEGGPAHGWSANSRWESVSERRLETETCARFRLVKPIFGAVVEKELGLKEGVPLLFQTHRFIGGAGALPVAHHAMTRMAAGGRLSFSPKRYAFTSEEPLEPPGRHRLLYPARSGDLSAFPAADGSTVDLHAYPTATGHEDFVTLVEAEDSALGWTAVLREAEDDIVFTLKNPKVLPVTMLWLSNGGRDYAPWNGRHTGVLGIEDGCSFGHAGHAGSIADNPLGGEGVPTALKLETGGTRTIRQIIGAVPRPRAWQRIAAVTRTETGLRLTESSGTHVDIPCDLGFLFGEER